MATTNSVTFRADANKVWRAVLRIINEGGYALTETNAAAKQLRYDASGGPFAWGQTVTVSVAEVGDEETMVTVQVRAGGTEGFLDWRQQKKLIEFVVEELKERFPLA